MVRCYGRLGDPKEGDFTLLSALIENQIVSFKKFGDVSSHRQAPGVGKVHRKSMNNGF